MNSSNKDIFEKLYPIVYQCFYAGENKNKIVKTRLPEYSDFSFIMDTEEQARKILKDKIMMKYSKEEKELNEKIKISKECKYRSLTYKFLPLLHDRFYQEWESSGILKIKNKELKEIDDIVLSNGILSINEKPFKFINKPNKIELFIAVNNSQGNSLTDGIYKRTAFKIGYSIDSTIKIKFSIILNNVFLKCQEDEEGKISILNKEDLNDLKVYIFTEYDEAKECRKKYIKEEIKLLEETISLKNEELNNI